MAWVRLMSHLPWQDIFSWVIVFLAVLWLFKRRRRRETTVKLGAQLMRAMRKVRGSAGRRSSKP